MQHEAIKTLLDIVSPHFESHKDAPAVKFDDGETMVVSTYSQLQKSTEQVTAVLKKMEVNDEIVGICVSPSHNLPAVLLGVIGSGAAFYNFEPGCANFVCNVVREMGIRVILVDQENLKRAEAVLLKYDAVTVSEVGMQAIGMILVHLEGQTQRKHTGNQLAYCITTSGTTGTPKIVRVPHQCIIPNITHLGEIFNINDNDLIFLSSPLTFDPSIVDLFLALGSGACLLIVPHVVKMMPKSLLSMLHYRHKVTYLQATPSLVSRIGPDILKKTLLGSLSHLKALAFGGEKFPSISLLQKWRAPDNSTKFFNLYGTTEVSCWSTCYEVTERDFSSLPEDVPLGLPLTDTIATVLDEYGQKVNQGRGQLFIGGIKRRQCYLDEEEPGRGPPILRATGDIVAINCKGEIIFLHRLDDQVKRNGRRINLCEIEKIVLKLDAVADCRVLFDQKKLVVFIVLQRTKTIIDSQTIYHWIQMHLPSQYCPDGVVMVSKFPVTSHGKLDKARLLQRLYDEPRAGMDSVSAERIPVVLETIWKEIFQTKQHTPTMDSNFITSGGDSLMAVQFSDKVEASFNMRLPKLLDLILHDIYPNILCYIERCVCDQMQTSLQQSCQKENMYLHKFIKAPPIDTDELVMKKKGTDSLNLDHVDGVISDLNEEKTPLNLSTFTEGKLSNRKRKYSDMKIHLADYQDTNHLCNELFRTETCYRSVSDEMILSVGRGNSGIISSPISKKDFKRTYHPVCHGTSGPLTPECNLNIKLADSCIATQQWNNLILEICWKVNTRKCVDASPVIARDRTGRHTVFIGSHSHKFFAITMETGEVQWETNLGDRIESSACVSVCGHYVIVGCYDGAIYVMECLTGEIWWKYETGAEVKSSPVVDPETSLVYVGSHDKHLHALDIMTRTCLFKAYLGGGSVFSSPCVNSSLHTVYMGTLSGAMFAVDSRNGDILWTYDCKKPLFSSPVVSTEGVYIGCVDGCLYHLSKDGKLIWSFDTMAPVFSSPAFYQQHSPKDLNCRNKSSNRMVLIGSHDHCIYLLTHDGKLSWKKKLDSPVYSTPFCFDLVIDECGSRICFEDKSSLSSISSKEKSDSVKVYVDVPIRLKTDIHSEYTTNIYSKRSLPEKCYTADDHQNECIESDICRVQDTATCSISNTECHIPTETFVNQEGEKTDQLQNSAAQEQFTMLFKHRNIVKCHGNKGMDTYDTKSKCHGNKGIDTYDTKSRLPYGRMPLCVVATTAGSVYVIDTHVGQEVGVVKLPGEVFSSPVVYGPNIVIGCRDDYVYCLNITPATYNSDIVKK